ncbi:MAG TPA: class I SAM-dependent methyltransferase [Jatrophihabitans sp.]|nr:class I SAM-dependent methyltransferase [Jatrophihabitans sp.]
MTNPRTLAAYESGVEQYLAALAPAPGAAQAAHREAFAAGLPAAAQVLEIGSGPGLDADWLQAQGVQVRRTDAAAAFVHRLQRLGHAAERLDVLTDPLGGPYDGIWANAVLLHLSRAELAPVLSKLHAALRPSGYFGFSVKEGDGERWVPGKLAQPRYFVYWRPDPLRALLHATGWQQLELRRARGRQDDWLLVRCRA